MDQGYHWNQSARSYFRIGKSLGADMVTLLSEERVRRRERPSRNPVVHRRSGTQRGVNRMIYVENRAFRT